MSPYLLKSQKNPFTRVRANGNAITNIRRVYRNELPVSGSSLGLKKQSMMKRTPEYECR